MPSCGESPWTNPPIGFDAGWRPASRPRTPRRSQHVGQQQDSFIVPPDSRHRAAFMARTGATRPKSLAPVIAEVIRRWVEHAVILSRRLEAANPSSCELHFEHTFSGEQGIFGHRHRIFEPSGTEALCPSLSKMARWVGRPLE
jgi:hypothetical protein